MLGALILLYALCFSCKKIYVYDQDPVAELDTETIGQAQFYITESDGVFITTMDPLSQQWSAPTPLVGMNTQNFMPLNTNGGSEQFGLQGVEARGIDTPSPFTLANGVPPALVIVDDVGTVGAPNLNRI